MPGRIAIGGSMPGPVCPGWVGAVGIPDWPGVLPFAPGVVKTRGAVVGPGAVPSEVGATGIGAAASPTETARGDSIATAKTTMPPSMATVDKERTKGRVG